jgi:hypothetical protein
MRIIVTGGWTLMKKDIPPTIAGAGGSSARRRAEPEQERAPKKAGETREKIEISAEQRARFRSISGSENPAFAVNLACQVEAAQWRGNSRSDKQQEEQVEAMLVAMSGMEPRDVFEGMLIAQAIATHNAVMECHRRAMIPEQSFEGRRENLNQANRLSRTFAALSEALDRHRGKGQQRITVEHVNVQAGGQAIVGAVTSGVRSNQSSQEQTRAMPEITHEPIIPMRSPDPEWRTVSVPASARKAPV